MRSGAPTQADGLLNLAQAGFSTLWEAEKKLLHAASRGEVAWCGPNQDDQEPANDPSQADKWGPERSIRAELVRWLCVDRDAKNRVGQQGIQLHAARIFGGLNLSFVAVPFPLTFRRCRFTHDAELVSAVIPQLDLGGSWVQRIRGDGASVKGNVFLREGFRAHGAVSLVGAEIGGNLNCDGGTFENPPREKVADSGRALDAEGINVKGSVFLRYRFIAEGEVRLLSARIGGTLEGDGGTFKNARQERVNGTGFAVNADRISVNGGVFLRNGFTAEGAVRLPGAQIGGNLDCGGGTFSELDAHTAAIKSTFYWFQLGNVQPAKLDLRSASAGSITDDERSWPAYGNLDLDGFVYERISGGPTGGEERLKWLRLQNPFRPQPYRQLAKVLREMGDEKGAQRVFFEMEDRLWKEDHRLSAFIFRWPLRLTVGYGYDPLRSFWWLMLLSGVGWIVYRRAHLMGTMAPTDQNAYESFRLHGRAPSDYQGFMPLIYSVENSLPLVKLGQAERWQPDPNPGSLVPSDAKWLSRLSRLIASRRFLLWFLWIQILLGWILATLFVAAVTGIVHTM